MPRRSRSPRPAVPAPPVAPSAPVVPTPVLVPSAPVVPVVVPPVVVAPVPPASPARPRVTRSPRFRRPPAPTPLRPLPPLVPATAPVRSTMSKLGQVGRILLLGVALVGISIFVAVKISDSRRDSGATSEEVVPKTEVVVTRMVERPFFYNPDLAIELERDKVVHLDGDDGSRKLGVGRCSVWYKLPDGCYAYVLDGKKCDFYYVEDNQVEEVLSVSSDSYEVRRHRGQIVMFRIPDDGDAGMKFTATK